LRDGERGLGLPSPASLEFFEQPSDGGMQGMFDGCDPDKDEKVGFGGTDCGRRPFRPGLRVSSFSTFSGSSARPKTLGLSQKDVPSLIAASLGGDDIFPACDFFGSVDGDRIVLVFVGVATIFSLNYWTDVGHRNFFGETPEWF